MKWITASNYTEQEAWGNASGTLKPACEAIAAEVKSLFGIEVATIYASSVYRTPARDKAVGGSGAGPHTKGKAIDFYMLNASGGKISSIYILLAAQSIRGAWNINGLERITDGYSVHIDIGYRTSKWTAYQTVSGGKYVYVNVPGHDWRNTSWGKNISIPEKTYPLLQHGSTGKDVAWLQQRLGLPTTWIYGDAEVAAVKAFQKSRGLTVDGKAGKLTLSALGY